MRILAAFLAAVATLPLASSFSPMAKPSMIQPMKSIKHQTSLAAVSPEHLDAINSMTTAMDGVHHFLSASSTLLADASADVAADATEKTGWWQSYLSIFKATLTLVHSTIDEPLRKIGITHTWGISIALFTAGVRSLLIPLSVNQSKSAEYRKALNPYIKQVREKFKDDKDSQNRAISKLYEDANQNPLSGCLVSLAQLPIFLGLYRGVRLLAMDGKLQEPFLWIPSLEGPVSAPTFRGMDWLTTGWVSDGSFPPTPQLGWETTIAYLIMPVILVLGQSFTMSVLSPPPEDDMSEDDKEQFEKSQRVLKFLPLMIGYFSLQVPAGLTIYWLTSNAFTLTQSLAVKAYYRANPPKIELPDYWDALEDVANMTPEERRKAAEAGINTGPKFSELLDEAKFHFTVERTPLRSQSEAWSRIAANGASSSIPDPMKDWVGSDVAPAATASEEEPSESSVETTAAPTA